MTPLGLPSAIWSTSVLTQDGSVRIQIAHPKSGRTLLIELSEQLMNSLDADSQMLNEGGYGGTSVLLRGPLLVDSFGNSVLKLSRS